MKENAYSLAEGPVWRTMLLCWCVLRVAYITVAVRYVPELETVSRAYPITWTCSSIIFLAYFYKADWMHNFERIEAKRKKLS